MKKKILALLLALMMLGSVALLSACTFNFDFSGNGDQGGENPGGDEGENPGGSEGENPGGNEGENPGGNEGENPGDDSGSKPDDKPDTPSDEPKIETYTVSAKTIGGLAVQAMLYVYPDATSIIPINVVTLDASGNGSVQLEAGKDYTVSFVSLPEGFVAEARYDLEKNTEIILKTEVVAGNTDFSGKELDLGDVMLDFAITTTDGDEFRLSDVLKTKKAVLINFFFTTCGPCATEFPYMVEAYEQYKNDIEVIAISPSYMGDTLAEVKSYKEEMGLTFPVAWTDSSAMANAFGISGFPTSIVVDRYGTICLIEVGAVTSAKPFNYTFSHFSSASYEQTLFESIGDLIPIEYPTFTMPESSEMGAVLNKGDISVTYSPETGEGAELSWPFIIGEKNGVSCVYASNQKKDSSYAMLYSYVELKAGQALAIDYYASTEKGADYLVVIVDGKDIVQIHGDSSDEGWKTAYPYVATEDGTYEVVFAYLKDEDTNFGEDTVYLSNYRVIDPVDIGTATYIPRFGATDLGVIAYKNYIDVFYNENDGYYHVHDANGPLLLVNLLLPTRFNEEKSVLDFIGTGEETEASGAIYLNGKNIYETVIKYCNYASNSKYTGYVPVTKELRECLIAIAAKGLGYGSLAGIAPEDEWVAFGLYYDKYGTDEQLEDPIKGLANFSAYDAILNDPSDTTTFPNKFVYDRIIMPRGLRAKFVPTESGVYLISSNNPITEQNAYSVNAWIFLEDNSIYAEFANTNRFPTDHTNCYMLAYLEAGTAYYIDIAYYDVTQYGTVTYNIRKLGGAGYDDGNGSYYRFGLASPGTYTYDINDPTFTLIDGGIKVEYDEVADCYYEILADGSRGDKLYADFKIPTNMFGDKTLLDLLELGAFNFTVDEDGNGVEGKADMTERVREILASSMIDEGEEGVIDYATDGCVVVTRELASILQMLMDKYTFKLKVPGDDYELGSWKKVCFRFEYFGPENITMKPNV